MNFTLLKEDLNTWSQVNDFGLENNIVQMDNYNSKQLFLKELDDLENSLSSVGQIVMKPTNLHSIDDTIIQFKVTDNVSKIINII